MIIIERSDLVRMFADNRPVMVLVKTENQYLNSEILFSVANSINVKCTYDTDKILLAGPIDEIMNVLKHATLSYYGPDDDEI